MSFLRLPRRRMVALVPVLVAGLVLAGIHGCLNPTFVNGLSGGAVVPLAPGGTPFVHILVINATAASTLSFQFGWTPAFQGQVGGYITNIVPRSQRGLLVGCPVEEIGLGYPLNLSQPAVVITNTNGTINVPASAFPLVFKNGEDYFCGDSLVLSVIDDPTNGYGIKIVSGRVDGTTQEGPFTGPDTFQIVQLLLTANGTPPTTVP
jgi:hypothetical protein